MKTMRQAKVYTGHFSSNNVFLIKREILVYNVNQTCNLSENLGKTKCRFSTSY